MGEVLFYHLQDMRLEQVLPPLLEKSLERGWRVVVEAGSAERVEALDAHLWTYRDDSFLPHGCAGERDSTDMPIVLTSESDNPNGAQVRFLIEGASLPADDASYERLVLIFDGDDDVALARAREAWSEAKRRDLAATYWQPDAQGRWQRKA